MDREEYDWNKKELLKHRNLPYHFANEELAAVFFTSLRKEYPGATIHYYDIHQWICLTDGARAKLREEMIEMSSKLSLKLAELTASIANLKKKERAKR